MHPPIIFKSLSPWSFPFSCFCRSSDLFPWCFHRSSCRDSVYSTTESLSLNPLNAELNPICYLPALLAHHFLHVSRIRVKSLTLRLLMSYIYIYIYMEHLFLMFLDHTQRRTTVGRTPLGEWSARRRETSTRQHTKLTTDKYPCSRWDSNPRSQEASGLWPLTCWDCWFESHRGHGYLSVVSVVCCQVEVSATSWSFVQRSSTDCGASLCVI